MTEKKNEKRRFPTALIIALAICYTVVVVMAVLVMGTVFTYVVGNAIRTAGANLIPGNFTITQDAIDAVLNTGDGADLISDAAKEKLIRIKSILQSEYYFDNIDSADYDTAVIKGYVDALGDPYTVYYTPEEYAEMNEDMEGSFSGIGVVVQQDANTGIIKIVRPYDNGPGKEAGMQPEDIVYKVNGEEVTGVDLQLVVSDIRGEEGTTVDIQVYRPSTNEYIDMTVTRRRIDIEVITHKMLDHQIGYIEMTSFSEVTYPQFMEAFRDLQSQGMESLVIDIRDNGGGLLSSVTDLLNDLLPEGIITYTEDRNGYKEEYFSNSNCVLDIPTVVLVNGNSASASEIFTGAMQDYHKATIMGTQTFGKGIVQTIMPLGDGSALKVTISRYFTPNGICIHEIGITPDVIVEQDYATEEDEQLDAAVDYLLNSLEN